MVIAHELPKGGRAGWIPAPTVELGEAEFIKLSSRVALRKLSCDGRSLAELGGAEFTKLSSRVALASICLDLSVDAGKGSFHA